MNKSDEFQKFLEVMQNLSSITSGIEPKRQEIVSELVKIRSNGFPHKLYHYTNLQGVKGILQSNLLRATDFRFLNDASELVYGANILVEELENYGNHAGGDVRALLNKIINYYKEHGDIYRQFFETYIVSFSEEPDMLSQWRAYADNAQGYCIEFDFSDSALFTIIGTQTPWSMEILLATYEEKNQRQLIHLGVEKLLDYLNSTDWPLSRIVNASEMEQWVVLGLLMYAFEPFVTSFKHPSFYEEKEWRAIASCASNLTENCKKTRGIDPNSSSYVECIFVQGDEENLWQRELLPVTKVIQGPLTDKASVAELNNVIEECGYTKHLYTEKSKIPLK